MIKKTLWLRAETKPHEMRTALTPIQARELLKEGFDIVVERTNQRIFKDAEYSDVGCRMVNAGDWVNAPVANIYILGLKELPKAGFSIKHEHIFFAHAYKGQSDGPQLLNRFKQGGGKIYDLEFLVDEKGKRVSAFGVSAGVGGALVSLEIYCQKHLENKTDFKIKNYYDTKQQALDELKEKISRLNVKPRSIVVGGLGRVGKGVREVLDYLNLQYEIWDLYGDKKRGTNQEVLDTELFFNCILLNSKIDPFITQEDLSKPKKLSIIADISCDPTSPNNPLPIYNDSTTFDKPTVKAGDIDVMAIDHLPSYTPRESSEDFCNQLFPHLKNLLNGIFKSTPWERSLKVFEEFTK